MSKPPPFPEEPPPFPPRSGPRSYSGPPPPPPPEPQGWSAGPGHAEAQWEAPIPEPPPPPRASADDQARTWATLCHLGGLAMYIGIPLGNIIAPLVIWLIKRHESPLVDRNGKEALNFQISLTIYLIASGLFSILLIGIPFLIGFAIAGLILSIMAAIRVSNGEDYQYPMTIRFMT